MQTMLFAATAMLFNLDPVESIPRIFRAGLMLVRWCFGRRDIALGEQRLAACAKCAMFDPERHSCGHIPETMEDPGTGRLVPLGCWCYLPVAAQIPSKDCWARANDLEEGWPDELRP
jgi:hypothetical protein